MSRRKEPCRNFLRGSCRYGDQCKFLHQSQQQPKANPFGFGTQNASQTQGFSQQSKPNPFGFGVQSATQPQSLNQQHKPNPFEFGAQSIPQSQGFTQQQKPNPFGFGVKSSSQLNNSSDVSSRYQSANKPFENKWTRTSSSTPSQHSDAQPQAHKCSDPESCKRQIIEDSKNEAPLWKLTCYGHCKSGPCDVLGDISYEELRAAAYDDSRRGVPLQSIVERERNLLNSKIAEFDNLLRNPYVPQNSGDNKSSIFPGVGNISSPPLVRSSSPPSLRSFSQLGPSTNPGSNKGIYASENAFSTMHGHSNAPQSTNHALGGFGTNLGIVGNFGAQQPFQPPGVSLNSPTLGFAHQLSNVGSILTGSSDGNKFAPVTAHSHTAPVRDIQEPALLDESVWLKEAWAVGEIPESEPPLRFC